MLLEKSKKEMERLLATVHKQFGAESLMRLGDKKGVRVPCFSSGSIAVDSVLEIGGYPKGRLVEIYGPESSGKTTLTLHAVAQVQKEGGVCAFIDAEHALDTVYAKKLGVDVDNLLVSQPDHGEQALAITHAILQSGTVALVVVDSVAALVPKAELDGQVGDHHVGSQARMMAQAMRMLTGEAFRSGATVIFINQTRQKIGVMFGNPETTPGGNALKFFASVRLEVRRIGQIKKSGNDSPTGARTRVKVTKNKLAPPFRQAEFDIIYGLGVVFENELIEYGEKAGLVSKSGAWYAYGEQRLGNGKENAAAYLREHPEVGQAIYAKLVKTLWGQDDKKTQTPAA